MYVTTTPSHECTVPCLRGIYRTLNRFRVCHVTFRPTLDSCNKRTFLGSLIEMATTEVGEYK